jgi:predicted nucleic acid-binding protein
MGLPPVIIDASIAIAMVRKEPIETVVRAAVRGWTQLDRDLIVPAIFWFEVVNALSRRHRYRGLDLLRAVHELDELELVTVDPDRPLLLLTIDYVERFGLTAYDASYLALAEVHGGDIATLDGALIRAAGTRAINLDERHRLSEPPAPYEHAVTWPNYKRASAYLAQLRAEARDA